MENNRRKKGENWNWVEHPAEHLVFIKDLTKYLHKKEDVTNIDEVINKKIDGLAKKKLGLDRGYNFNIYFEHSWRSADYLAYKAIYENIYNENLQQALLNPDFIKNNFGYKFAHCLAEYAVQYIKYENNNDLNEGILRFARGIFYLRPVEAAFGLSQLKDFLAEELPELNKTDTENADLKVEVKATIAKLIVRTEEFVPHITPEFSAIVRDSLANSTTIAGERPEWLQTKDLRRRKKQS